MANKFQRPQSVVDDQDECVVSGAMYVVLRVCQILGVAPVRFRKHKDGWAMRTSNILGLINYVFSTVLALSYMIGMALIQRKMPPHIHVLRLPVTEVVLGVCGNLFIMIVPTLMGYTSLGRLKSITIGFNRIQKTSQINRSLFKISRKSIVLIVTYIIIMLSFGALNKWFMSLRNLLPEALLQHCVIDIYQLMTVFTLLQFIFVTLEVKTVLQLVNNRLSKVIIHEETEKEKEKYMFAEHNSTDEIIDTLLAMYGTICEVVEQINEAFGFTVMTILWLCCWTLVLYPYCLTQSLIPELFTWKNIFYFGSESVVSATWLLMVVEPSQRLNFEMSRTVNLVSCLSMRRRQQEANVQLRQFQQHLLLCKVQYKPMHICTLDRPLVVTITGFVITYLVICIQLKQLGDSH